MMISINFKKYLLSIKHLRKKSKGTNIGKDIQSINLKDNLLLKKSRGKTNLTFMTK